MRRPKDKAKSGLRVHVREGLCIEQRPDSCGLVIFGASGDLTSRKLFPSLNYLEKKGLLPRGFYVAGVARSPLSDAALRKKAKGLKPVYYVQGDYADPKTYSALKKRLAQLDKKHKAQGNLIFYLATPPKLYSLIPKMLHKVGLLKGLSKASWARVIIEKPFGRDLESAQALDRSLAKVLREDQIYRIDHYLGKETVQNILIFRFANAIFEPLWNRKYIDHIQISVLESVALENRAGYYDQSGVLRDMFQNHMTQLLALTAMEPPSSFDADRVRDEKVKVYRSLRPLQGPDLGKRVVLGQYEGYRKEKGVSEGSRTPTFAAMKLEIENWRWKGVPFYLRTGKNLKKREAEIAVQFKSVPHSLFSELAPSDLSSNLLVFRIQPDEGISLRFETKKPGPKLCIGALTMDFDYSDVFGEDPPEAYQRLLLDCMQGDQTLFIRSDAVEATWSFFAPLLKRGLEPCSYPGRSSGPREADALIESDGRLWREL
ncbi:MAG: glucose-6-phosphate dehydrogenase [Elusimicrobiota bacterium]